MKYIYIILLLFAVQTAEAQRLIRRNSRHFITQQTLPDRVEPLLKDVWDQYAPNNDMCPVDSTGERAVVGCVATAMSQVMHYWQWPITGRGQYTYNDSIGCQQVLSADFSSHTYDWANMLDKYEEGKYTKEQGDAVALLSSDCGISLNMRYGAATSGANSVYQPIALTEYFGYDRGIQMLYRDFYSLDEIVLMLKQELAAGRPILISAHSKTNGHAFVIDGYDERDWFHTCWGNPGGIDNTFTYLPNMVPYQPEWYNLNSPEGGFNLLQSFTIGVMPENHSEANGIERHNFAFQSISAVVDSTMLDAKYDRNNVRLTTHDLCNIGWNVLNDSVSLMLKKDDRPVHELYTYEHDFVLEETEDTTFTDTLSIAFSQDIEDGVYTIVPMYRDNHASIEGEKEWREARTCTGTPNYLIATVRGDEVTLSSDTASTAYLTLEDFEFPDLLVNAFPSLYTIRLRNHGPEMAGRVYFVLESLEEEGKSFILQEQGVTIGRDEEYVIDNYITKLYAPKLGMHKLHILYENNLFADDVVELPLPEEHTVMLLVSGHIQIAMR